MNATVVLEQGREITIPEKAAAWLSQVAEAAGVSISTYIRDYLVPAKGAEHSYEAFIKEGGAEQRKTLEEYITAAAVRQCDITKTNIRENRQLTEEVAKELPEKN